jgi:hypothetical protein
MTLIITHRTKRLIENVCDYIIDTEYDDYREQCLEHDWNPDHLSTNPHIYAEAKALQSRIVLDQEGI